MRAVDTQAHPAPIGLAGRTAPKPPRRRISELLASIRRSRADSIERAYLRQANGVRRTSLPGSEHTHLLRRPRGF